MRRRLEEVEFRSEGTVLRGRLFLPASRTGGVAQVPACGGTAPPPDPGGPKELHELEGGHFGLLHWPGEVFDHACAVQSDFLRRTLLADRP